MKSYMKKTSIKFHHTVMSLKSKIFKIKSIRLPQILTTERDTSNDPKKREKVEILVFGTINMDYITYINEHPKTGETVKAMYREQCFGGKGANQAVAAAKLGANCALIAKLGKDDLGAIYYEYLQQVGVIADCVELLEGQETGSAQINIDDNAQTTNVQLPGANAMLSHKDINRCKRAFYEAKVFLCQMDPDYKTVLCALKQFRKISILNASPAMKDMPPELIKAPTILCINRAGAALLTDRKEIKFVQDAKEAAKELVEKGAKNVIITMDSLGAVFLSQTEPDTCIHCPAAPVRYLADTSGAGDAFLGSLAYHLVLFPKLNLEHHIHAANICAAYAVGHRGTQPSFPGPDLAQQDLCVINPVYYIILDETPQQKEARERKAAELEAPAKDAKPEPVKETKPEPVPEATTQPEEPPAPAPVLDVLPGVVAVRMAAVPAATSSTAPISALETVEVEATKSVSQKQVQRVSDVAAAMVSTRNTQVASTPAVPVRMMAKSRRVYHKKPIRNIQKSQAH